MGAGAVRGVLAARLGGLGEVPSVFDLLDTAADVVLQLGIPLAQQGPCSPLYDVGQPSKEQTLHQLPEMARQGDRPIAGDSLLVLPGLGDGDDPGPPPLLRNSAIQPGRTDRSEELTACDRSQVDQVLAADRPSGTGASLSWRRCSWRSSSAAENSAQQPLRRLSQNWQLGVRSSAS